MIATAVIADDERLPREKLRDFLADVSWIRCIGEAADGPGTVEMVNRERPDLLFLDIRMPGLSGIELLERLDHRPTLVFTTAFDEYAVTAFEVRALDYLLKPFGRKRLQQTLERVRESLSIEEAGENTDVDRAREALRDDVPLRRLFVRSRGRIVPLAISDVVRFEAQDDYVAIHTLSARFLANLRMSDLDRALDPEHFLRIHRSHIVNLEFIDSIEPHSSGRLLLTMRGGARLFASRARSQELRKRVV